MKKRTMISRAAAMMLTLALALMLAACGGSGKDDDKNSPNTKVEDNDADQSEGKKVTYSFEGAYASGTSDVKFEWVMNMYDDGTLDVEPGLVFLDAEDYEEKATGTWSETDGVLTFTMENEDGTFSREYEVEKDEEGGYLFGMELSLATFVRPIEMRCVTEGFIPAGEAEASSFN